MVLLEDVVGMEIGHAELPRPSEGEKGEIVTLPIRVSEAGLHSEDEVVRLGLVDDDDDVDVDIDVEMRRYISCLVIAARIVSSVEGVSSWRLPEDVSADWTWFERSTSHCASDGLARRTWCWVAVAGDDCVGLRESINLDSGLGRAWGLGFASIVCCIFDYCLTWRGKLGRGRDAKLTY